MLKRISAVSVVIAMLVTMLCSFSVGYAEEEKMTMTLTPSAEKVQRGETVTVTVSVQNYKPVAGLTIVNEIDSAKLEYVSNDPTKLAGIQFTNPNYNAGNDGYRRIRSTWADGNNIEMPEPNFDIWTVTYTVPEDAPLGETAVKFTFTEAFVWDDALDKSVSLLGTDVCEEEVTLNLEVYCDHAVYEGVTDGEHCHRINCDACGIVDKIEPCTFNEWVVVKQPTVEVPGEKERYCTVCNYHDIQEIPMIPGFVIKAEDSAIKGSQWVADVLVKNTEAGFSAVVVDVAYNSTVMTLTDVAMADGSTSEMLNWYDKGDGTVAITYITDGVYTDEESFIRLTFDVKEDAASGDYSLTVSTTDAVAGESGAEEQIDLAPAIKNIYISDHIWGDVNADNVTDAKDVVMILRYDAQLCEYSDLECPEAADVWEDGMINLKDAILILRRIVG